MMQSASLTIHKTAYWLGLAGLIPFVGLTALMFQPWSEAIFITYSAIILSFLGGIHWGVALQQPNWANSWRISLCMLPSLIGWLALALPHQWALITLVMAYAIWWAYDFSQINNKNYRGLRRCLTLVVIVCHLSWLFFH